MPEKTVRLAMWSGPRNISTALMRSWGNRPDTAVIDEPLYAHYLRHTRLPHPGAEEVLARYENDWEKVAAGLTGDIPGGRAIYFQKHMAHHLLPRIGRDWLLELSHFFLIRDPREMLTSLIRIYPDPRISDTGLPQQLEIYHLVSRSTGKEPPVVDAQDVLGDPRGVLGRLCRALGVEFTDAMLSWPPGPRETDGCWARHWYHEVEKTGSFRPYAPKPDPLPERFLGLHEECRQYYLELHERRIRP